MKPVLTSPGNESPYALYYTQPKYTKAPMPVRKNKLDALSDDKNTKEALRKVKTPTEMQCFSFDLPDD